ncbi:hypothetical protein [Ideonella alba]|uniref:Uncharacterized protein n=1 Tax=Ideonella alba TaxID=2824118 RepID=A0A941BJC4_9BURK|nr:hypothetical protein [Ideonella alba]MBQ0933678.1 hypothetical protein [Ideonella alba]
MKLSHAIDLPFTRESLLALLEHGCKPESSPFTHKQIAEWCDRFWCKYLDVEAPADIAQLLPLLTDVETQWDLYLANTYDLKQLQTEDFDHVLLPTEWFEDWLQQVQGTSPKVR